MGWRGFWRSHPAVGGPVSQKGRGEDAIAQNRPKRGVFSRIAGKEGLFPGEKTGGFPGFLFTDEYTGMSIKPFILLHLP